MRERSSRVCKLSMPSFLKKSSSGASAPGASLKCLAARFSTSWVVCSRVGMTAVNLSFPKQEEKFSFEFGRQDYCPKAPPQLPNVPEKSRQQPGSPWLLRDECTATGSLGAESNMEVANNQE